MRWREIVISVVLALLSSAIFEWLVKLPLEIISPGFAKLFVGVYNFKASVIRSAATYTENFTVLIVATGVCTSLIAFVGYTLSFVPFLSRYRVREIALAVTMLFVVIFNSFNGYAQILIHDKISWFRQSLDLLNPYISDLEQRKLRADWASMQNEADFSNIVSSINKLMESNGIKFRPKAPQ